MGHQELYHEKYIFNVWRDQKQVLVRLCILQGHQEHGHKNIFLNAGSGKNMFWCISAQCQVTRKVVIKKVNFYVWSGEKPN
jgi:hypothetical protein